LDTNGVIPNWDLISYYLAQNPLAENLDKIARLRAVRAFYSPKIELLCIKKPAPPPLFKDYYWVNMYKALAFCLIVFEPTVSSFFCSLVWFFLPNGLYCGASEFANDPTPDCQNR
jgi:hypothetical protein